MSAAPITVRLYTRARKIPFLLGKLGDWRIWGGPYTLTQMVAAVAVGFLGKQTMRFWAGDWPALAAWAVVLIAACAAGLLAGHIPLKGRNPVLIVQGLLGYATAPVWGKQAGRPVVLGRTHRLVQRESTPSVHQAEEPALAEIDSELEESLDEPAAVEPAAAEQRPHEKSARAAHQLNEVQRILAASAQRR